jgi:hypothetical protein
MSADRDVNRIVRSWLEEGVTALPDRVLDNVLDQLPATPQRRAWWPARRLRLMNVPARLAAVAAAVAAVVLIGVIAIARGGGVGQSPPASNSTASPSPTALPSPSLVALGVASLDRSLDAGTYRVGAPFAKPFQVTLPATWRIHALASGDANFAAAGSGGGVAVDLVEGVFRDPCHTGGGPTVPTPRTLDGFTTALTRMVGFTAGPVTDVTIGGRAGKFVIISNAIDTAKAKCTGGPMLPLWTYTGGNQAATNGGLTERLFVFDLGGTLVAIDGGYDASTPAALRTEIDGIVQSIVFD